jgi:polyisoprenoid-binding protein YceI
MNAIRRLRGWLVPVGVILLTSPTALLHAAQWQMDASASRLEFFITYTGQEAAGSFQRFTTQLDFDAADPSQGQLVVTVDVTSADMDSAEINEAMAAAEWFDYADFPEARFSSIRLIVGDNDHYHAIGALQLKGIEKDIDVPFSWRETEGNPDRSAVLSGELKLDRGDFGIGSGEWASGDMIGLAVTLRFEVHLHPANP